MFRAFLLLIIMLNNAWAGIDFRFGDSAMITPPTPGAKVPIPFFKSQKEAYEFANYWKYDPDLFQRMVDWEHELWGDAYSKEIGWMRPGQNIYDNIYWQNWYFCNLALRIMQNFKRRGIMRDPSMVGSSVFIGETPITKEK